MALSAALAKDADILHSHPLLSFDAGGYHYRIESNPDKQHADKTRPEKSGPEKSGSDRSGRGQSSYSVSDASHALTFPLSWAFGTGRVGQSYLFKQRDGKFYEARVTYYESLGNLGFTPFRALASAAGVEEAMYRPVDPAEVTRCFGCHATASSIGGHFDEEHLVPGVSCEACHGAGAGHIAAMDGTMGRADRAIDGAGNGPVNTPMRPVAAGKLAVSGSPIFNADHLAPADAVDYCGACHGTWWDVKLSGIKGVSTTRSAPYRLVSSKCWGKSGDARLTCTACHDPHEQLQTNAEAYDQACFGCHINPLQAKPAGGMKTAGHALPQCKVATKNCSSCHMPQVQVPEMHDNFTDHRIRIVKAGEAFPE